MFWNYLKEEKIDLSVEINRKHEMFWNLYFLESSL